MKNAFLRQPMNWLLLFLPVSIALERAHAPAVWVFAASRWR